MKFLKFHRDENHYLALRERKSSSGEQYVVEFFSQRFGDPIFDQEYDLLGPALRAYDRLFARYFLLEDAK